MIVNGTVQGVGFRWSARLMAERSGVSGWVRNLSDGSVEAHLEGSGDSVATVVNWFRSGPVGATVEAITTTEAPSEGLQGFQIRG